jgi:hypothetical protein
MLRATVLFTLALGCGGGSPSPSAEPTCSAGPLLTVSPVALTDFMGLTPLRHVAPPPHTFPSDHMYFYMRPDAVVPVVSPGAVQLVDVAEISTTGTTPEYTVYFKPCAEYQGFFYHLTALADSLRAHIGPFDDGQCSSYTTGNQTVRRCSRNVRIPLAAGDPIGNSGRVGGAAALDFGTVDARTPDLEWANPLRRPRFPGGIDSHHIVCPLDAYEPGMRAALIARLSDYSGMPRTRQPLCGEVMQDVKGTAQGIWFVAGTPVEMSQSPEDPHLALVHDNDFDTDREVFSVGTSLRRSGLDPSPYFFTPTASGSINRHFRDVTANGTTHCYEELGGVTFPARVVLLAMPSPTTLRVERIMAPSCDSARPWAFGATFTDFER